MNSYQSGNAITNPNVACKHFNPLYVDFIWMEETGSSYQIYHKREDKHEWLPGIEDTEYGQGFTITGNPCPFTDKINIEVTVEGQGLTPSIEIYNTGSQLVRNLTPTEVNNKSFIFTWDGRQASGNFDRDGVYIILCSVGDKRTARKIIYKP
jgi:hypothetical protein